MRPPSLLISSHCRLSVVYEIKSNCTQKEKKRTTLTSRSPSLSPPITPQELSNHNNKNPKPNPRLQPTPLTPPQTTHSTQLNSTTHTKSTKNPPSAKYCNSDPPQKKEKQKWMNRTGDDMVHVPRRLKILHYNVHRARGRKEGGKWERETLRITFLQLVVEGQNSFTQFFNSELQMRLVLNE